MDTGVEGVALLTIFVLSAFTGYEVISKVSTVLHTPLLSGANAIHGVILIGAILVAGTSEGVLELSVGLLAVGLATVNLVGGFVVTDRMLQMFGRGRPALAGGPAGSTDGSGTSRSKRSAKSEKPATSKGTKSTATAKSKDAVANEPAKSDDAATTAAGQARPAEDTRSDASTATSKEQAEAGAGSSETSGTHDADGTDGDQDTTQQGANPHG